MIYRSQSPIHLVLNLLIVYVFLALVFSTVAGEKLRENTETLQTVAKNKASRKRGDTRQVSAYRQKYHHRELDLLRQVFHVKWGRVKRMRTVTRNYISFN